MRKINCLIIGAQKAGTTSLYEYIKQHPDVYFSEIKEITYFVVDKYYKKGIEYFHSFFSKYNNEKIIASSYVHMLPSQDAPERVLEYNKNMKFIIMLREPVSRAYSSYNYAIKNDWENIQNSFLETIELEKKRIERKEYDLMYFENGKYFKHIKYWNTYFPKDNFLILKDSELRSNGQEVVNKIFDFLKIRRYKINTNQEYNKAGIVRVKWLQSFLLNKSVIKKVIGSFFSEGLRVWIRSVVFKKIYSLNQINKANTPLDLNTEKQIRLYFEDDLKQLAEEYGISFEVDHKK